MIDARTPRRLQVRRSRGRLLLLWMLVLASAAAVGAWFATHPAPLPVPGEPIEVSAPLGQAVYVGIYHPAADDDSTLHVDQVTTDVDGEAVVATLVCKGGSVSVTSEPETFCADLVHAEGQSVEPGDALLLEIQDDEPGSATIPPVEISYREGLQWGTHPVGPTVEATFVSR
jgi:hypothetical protein